MQRLGRCLRTAGAAAALCIIFVGAAQAAPVTVTAELSTKNVRTEESNLANVIADAVRAVEKADVAFVPASAFADVSIPKGTANADDILKAVEYRDDSVVLVKLTGAQIKKALEHALGLYPQKNSAFLQVSGLSATVDPAADKDKRVVSVKVGGAVLQDAKKYTVAMPSPLASGALGYFKIWDKTKDIDHDTNKSLAEAVNDYLGTVRTLGGKSEERLVFKK
jgi:5'-nucleotidase / UDP-sugar diphosphatase